MRISPTPSRTALLALSAAVAALSGFGGARSAAPRAAARRVTPQSAPTPATSSSGAAPTDFTVAARLTELVDPSAIGASAAQLARALRPERRRLEAPFARATPSVAVQQIALRIPGTQEYQGGGFQLSPGSWLHGTASSVVQREAIVALVPSAPSVSVELPAGARFEADVAAVGATSAVTFELVAENAAGRRVTASTVVVPRSATRWHALRADLASLGAGTCTLTLAARGDAVPRRKPGKGAPPAAALWGAPVVLAPRASPAPYNVLWIVVDAQRPDAAASFHDDATDRRYAAADPPMREAWLPRMPGLLPSVDALAQEGVTFTRAWSAATWTRPGTVAMLAGARSGEVGLPVLDWLVGDAARSTFYGGRAAMLPVVLRRHGFVTRAFVNNFYLGGYTSVGVDLGFEGIVDRRHPTRDTREITDDAVRWLREHDDERFFVFVNYNSPHAPYAPPKALVDAVPASVADPMVRKYLGEVAKDDAAIGELVAELARLGLTERTLVVVTADHGETLSAAHQKSVQLDQQRQAMRFRHSTAMYEETARVPMILRLPGRLPGGARVAAPVQTTDLAPTVVELLGLPQEARMSGQSLLPLLTAGGDAERAVIVEGRGARGIQRGRWHLVLRDAARVYDHGKPVKRELYDLEHDPGERNNVAEQHADVADELAKVLTAAVP